MAVPNRSEIQRVAGGDHAADAAGGRAGESRQRLAVEAGGHHRLTVGRKPVGGFFRRVCAAFQVANRRRDGGRPRP